MAAAATALNLPRHGKPWPLVLASLVAGTNIHVMFGSYDPVLEAIGLGLLIGAVGLDLYQVYLAECVPRQGNFTR